MRTLLFIALSVSAVPAAPLLAQELDRDSSWTKGRPYAFVGNPEWRTYQDAVDSLDVLRRRLRRRNVSDCFGGRRHPMVVDPVPGTPLAPGAWHFSSDPMPGSRVKPLLPFDCQGYRFLGPLAPRPPDLSAISTPKTPRVPAGQGH